MHSRSDQVQAHSFMTARVVSALVQGEPDAPDPPLRRTPLGYVIGLMLSMLIVAGFAVAGVLGFGGATDWSRPGKLIVEKETGSQYVLATDGTLRPVLNYASARLLGASEVAEVPRSTLSVVPRGTPIGIIGAPDGIPAGGAGGAGQAWLVCATTTRDAAGAPHPTVALHVGDAADAQPAQQDQAVLVRSTSGDQYLVWRDKRMKLSAPWVAAVLGYDVSTALPVRDAFINAVPAGPDLGPLQLPGAGQPGPPLGGQPTRIGQVFSVSVVGRPQTLHMLTTGGLMPVNGTTAALAMGDPAGGGQPSPRALSPAAMASAGQVPSSPLMSQLPDEPPALLPTAGPGAPCAKVEPGPRGARSTLAIGPAAGGVVVGGPGIESDEFTADRIDVQPGAGVLARTLPAPGVPGAGLYLVTDSGAKYPVPGQSAAEALGYRLTDAVPVPAHLLSLLPTGPVLAPERAAGGGAQAAP
ncbi:type VII secretion protein EccB [Saccharopolyspora mangrovi]|uniref:Type VII secretion protein EccB n=1 Tax=Saccharopolyspora mangrovi TaxID=3082379 RepID=A0ABU6A865_9PSEU|nr:type VII secretion protein EccB [Saccharopolyspora sp. S2-29]MEB3367700.1 type VII secretion protein EccB [Saccharopolyspora sp. S2-29]